MSAFGFKDKAETTNSLSPSGGKITTIQVQISEGTFQLNLTLLIKEPGESLFKSLYGTTVGGMDPCFYIRVKRSRGQKGSMEKL